MTQNPPEGFPRVTPYLLYHDCDAAIEFLTKTFGFSERMRMPGRDGTTGHAELELEGGIVMLGNPGDDFKNPNELGGRTQVTYIYVDDVDAHYDRAQAAGANIERELADQFYGDRTYSAHDPEGHSWSFATHVHDPSPEEMQAAMSS
ncbi:MAG: VOC family protein [Gaiellaceae bacterium]